MISLFMCLRNTNRQEGEVGFCIPRGRKRLYVPIYSLHFLVITCNPSSESSSPDSEHGPDADTANRAHTRMVYTCLYGTHPDTRLPTSSSFLPGIKASFPRFHPSSFRPILQHCTARKAQIDLTICPTRSWASKLEKWGWTSWKSESYD
jgi:hypothetical protein